MLKRSFAIGLAVAVSASVVFGQSVYINSPSPWTSLRSGDIVIKAQLDTAKTKKHSVTFTVSKMLAGKGRTIATKKVAGTEYYAEVSAGSAGTDILGGKEFIKIAWSISDTTEKGEVAPIGIVNVAKSGAKDSIRSAKIDDNATAQTLAQALSEKGSLKLGDADYGIFWNQKALFFACKKGVKGGLTIAIDGKNAKSAFVSYPDRFLMLFPEKDSVHATHYKRVFAGDSLSYPEQIWKSDMAKVSNETVLAISIPWYDLGMIAPFDGRQVGCTVLRADEKGKTTGSFPASAKWDNPGTWGTLLFKK
jgi:hypothetical protein